MGSKQHANSPTKISARPLLGVNLQAIVEKAARNGGGVIRRGLGLTECPQWKELAGKGFKMKADSPESTLGARGLNGRGGGG